MRQRLRGLFLEPFLEKRGHLALLILSLICLSLSQSTLLVLIGPFFKAMFSGSAAATPEILVGELLPEKLAGWWPNLAAVQLSRIRLAQILPLAILGVGIIKGISTYGFQLQQQVLALHLGRHYREKLFGATLRLPYERLAQRSPAEWMSLVVNDVHFLQVRISDLLSGFIRDGSVVLASLAALYLIHWPTALGLTFLSIPLTISTGRTGRKIAHFAESWQQDLGRMAGAVLDLRRRFEFIRAQHGEELEKQRFWKLNQGYYRMIRRSIFLRSLFAPSLEFLGFVLFALVLVLVREGYFLQEFEAADLLQFLAALGILIRPLKSIGEQLSRYHETKGILKNSLNTFAEVESQADTSPTTEWLSRGTEARACLVNKMELAYKQGFRLEASGLELRPGQTIAIIGPSGAGKSSLLKCFAGLVHPLVWQASEEWESFVRGASLVSQKPFLFTGSIKDNLSYGLPSPPPDDASLREVLEFVGLRDELEKMGQNLDTALDFIHSPLSGGQLQRLTIARALLRPTAYLLLDEVTSAIDPNAEEVLTRKLLLRAKSERRGLVFVTHRLSHLSLFDELWFCEAGRLTVFKQGSGWAEDPRLKEFVRQQKTY